MRSPEAVRIPIQKKSLPNGVRVNVVETKFQEIKKRIPGSTAIHEAKHIVAASVPVIMATIIPSRREGYNGLTQLAAFDPVAAVAPYATGSSGTGHDTFIVERMGYSVSSLAGTARRRINKNWDKVIAIADALEEKGTIGTQEIRRAMQEGSKKENTTEKSEVLFSITNRKGKEKLLKRVAIENGNVLIPGEWIKLLIKSKQGKNNNFQQSVV